MGRCGNLSSRHWFVGKRLCRRCGAPNPKWKPFMPSTFKLEEIAEVLNELHTHRHGWTDFVPKEQVLVKLRARLTDVKRAIDY